MPLFIARASSKRSAHDGKWQLVHQNRGDRFPEPLPCNPDVFAGAAGQEFGFLHRQKGLAAISACHKGSGDKMADKHPLICQIIEGARRLQTVSRSLAALWDLSLVLDGLSCPPFETVHQVGLTPNFHWIHLRCVVSLQRWRSRYVSF